MSWFKQNSRNDSSIAVLLGDTDTPAVEADAPPASPTAEVAPLPPAPAPRVVVESQRLTPSHAPAPAPVSVLGRTLKFRGELHADEDFVLQGSIEGSIHHTQHLTVGVDGVVRGDSRARTLVVEGTVYGDLYALESISLTSTAVVNGNLFGPRISIADGATFNGRIDMASAAKAARSVLEHQEQKHAVAVTPDAPELPEAGVEALIASA